MSRSSVHNYPADFDRIARNAEGLLKVSCENGFMPLQLIFFAESAPIRKSLLY